MFAKAFMDIPAQHTAKVTLPPMPAADPAVPTMFGAGLKNSCRAGVCCFCKVNTRHLQTSTTLMQMARGQFLLKAQPA